jgi:hypothetical protein
MRPALLAIAAAMSLLASSPPGHTADVEAPAPYAVRPPPGDPYGGPYGRPYGGQYETPYETPYAVQPAPEVPVGPSQYVYGGHSYCWFPGGWHGPGWYVCDYGPWVRGYWWGGPVGWQGWAWRGPRRFAGPRIYGGFRGGPAFGRGPDGMHHR